MRIYKSDPRILDWLYRAESIADGYSDTYNKPTVRVYVTKRSPRARHLDITYGRALDTHTIHIMLGNDDDDVEPTIIHELAHLKAGLDHRHDEKWARELITITRDLGFSDALIEAEIATGCIGSRVLERVYRYG